jgi:hypothetical protein
MKNETEVKSEVTKGSSSDKILLKQKLVQELVLKHLLKED